MFSCNQVIRIFEARHAIGIKRGTSKSNSNFLCRAINIFVGCPIGSPKEKLITPYSIFRVANESAQA